MKFAKTVFYLDTEILESQFILFKHGTYQTPGHNFKIHDTKSRDNLGLALELVPRLSLELRYWIGIKIYLEVYMFIYLYERMDYGARRELLCGGIMRGSDSVTAFISM